MNDTPYIFFGSGKHYPHGKYIYRKSFYAISTMQTKEPVYEMFASCISKDKKGVQSRNFKLKKHSNLANRNQTLEAKVSSKEKLKELSCCRVHACSSYHYTN